MLVCLETRHLLAHRPGRGLDQFALGATPATRAPRNRWRRCARSPGWPAHRRDDPGRDRPDMGRFPTAAHL